MLCALHPSGEPMTFLSKTMCPSIRIMWQKYIQRAAVNKLLWIPALHFQPRKLNDQSRGTCPARAEEKKKERKVDHQPRTKNKTWKPGCGLAMVYYTIITELTQLFTFSPLSVYVVWKKHNKKNPITNHLLFQKTKTKQKHIINHYKESES